MWTAEVRLSSKSGIKSALVAIGLTDVCERLRVVAERHTFQAAPGNRTKTLGDLPLMTLSRGARATTVFAGR